MSFSGPELHFFKSEGGWLEKVKIKLTQLPTKLKFKLRLKLNLALLQIQRGVKFPLILARANEVFRSIIHGLIVQLGPNLS